VLIHLEVGKGEMKKFSIAALLLLTAAFSFGQAPRAALYTPEVDVYVGYIATFPDYGTFNSHRFDGAEVALTRNLRPHIGIVASGAFTYRSALSVKQFSGTIGPKFNLLTGPFRPYATVQVGYAHQSSDGLYAADHHPPLAKGATDTESGFTYRIGAGADLQLKSHLYWRVVQWDIQPQPWGRHTPFYVNLSSGVGYRF
jgi:Outer membrane protein beta-barrel domain